MRRRSRARSEARQLIAFEDFSRASMNTDRTDARQLTLLPGDEATPVFGPDGKLIVFVYFDCEKEDLGSLHVMTR